MRTPLLAAVTALFLAATPAFAVDKDCVDFATHEQAQAYFDAHPGDPDLLDGDGDGIACEALLRADGVPFAGDDGERDGGGSDSAVTLPLFAGALLVAGGYAAGVRRRS